VKGPDFLRVTDLDQVGLERVAQRALDLAECWDQRKMPQTLKGARLGVIEELPGWRNPTALALGTAQMGATCVPLSARLEGHETVEDLAGYMNNWFDLVAVRTPNLTRLGQFADAMVAPALNLRTNDNHPCEILGDLVFMLSHGRAWEGLRVAMVGPAGNVAQSWMEAAEVLPISVTHVTAPQLQFPPQETPARWSSPSEPDAILEADLIVTDCWPEDVTPEERDALASFCIDAAVLDRCRSDAAFVPCPPVTRGEEVTEDAMQHPKCMATKAKAHLLHVQNALVEALL
jgi:ornithine carbamoyltransferase